MLNAYIVSVTSIGEAIKATRLAQKVGLRALEASTGINRGTLSKIERGLTPPSEEELRLIREALGMPLADHPQGDDVTDRPRIKPVSQTTTEQQVDPELRRYTIPEVIKYRLLPYKNVETVRRKCRAGKLYCRDDGGQYTFTPEDIRRNAELAAVVPLSAVKRVRPAA